MLLLQTLQALTLELQVNKPKYTCTFPTASKTLSSIFSPISIFWPSRAKTNNGSANHRKYHGCRVGVSYTPTNFQSNWTRKRISLLFFNFNIKSQPGTATRPYLTCQDNVTWRKCDQSGRCTPGVVYGCRAPSCAMSCCYLSYLHQRRVSGPV